jgi:hypothetical protein
MPCVICKDTGKTYNGMYNVVYCSCAKGESEYRKNVVDADCTACQNTGKRATNGGGECFCYCKRGRAVQDSNDT